MPKTIQIVSAALLFAALARPVPAQSPITVALAPVAPTKGVNLRWSPKGETVSLKLDNGALAGTFPIGPAGSPGVQVRLTKNAGDAHYTTLWIDLNRDGKFSADEKLVTTPTDTRNKWWSSFDTEVRIPVAAHDGAAASSRPYPLSLWYVEDPQEPDAAPVLRWSRRGWHEGTVQIGGKLAYVLITEMNQDGIFDQRDSWSLSRDSVAVRKAEHGLDEHAWLDSAAYRPVKIDPDGFSITFVQIHPATTEAEELAKKDLYAPDRTVQRTDKPMHFAQDLPAAMAQAKRENKRVLIDFEAVWCGPCHTMDTLVFTARSVAAAAANVIPVKVDGDDHRDWKKQYNVDGFPTLILLDASGKEIRRGVGYQSVLDMVALLKQ